jgi:hypothetical protein
MMRARPIRHARFKGAGYAADPRLAWPSKHSAHVALHRWYQQAVQGDLGLALITPTLAVRCTAQGRERPRDAEAESVNSGVTSGLPRRHIRE